jgi:hypothetical protein
VSDRTDGAWQAAYEVEEGLLTPAVGRKTRVVRDGGEPGMTRYIVATEGSLAYTLCAVFHRLRATDTPCRPHRELVLAILAAHPRETTDALRDVLRNRAEYGHYVGPSHPRGIPFDECQNDGCIEARKALAALRERTP